MVDDQDTPVKSGSVNNLSHQSSKDEPPSIKNGPERLINLMLVWWTNIKIKIYGNSFPFPFHVIMKLLCFQALLGGGGDWEQGYLLACLLVENSSTHVICMVPWGWGRINIHRSHQ